MVEEPPPLIPPHKGEGDDCEMQRQEQNLDLLPPFLLSPPMAQSPLTQIPNLITIARIVAIPVIVALVMTDDTNLRLVALILYIVAAASDWLDGYLARKWNQTSPLGRMLDPIADKLLVGLVIAALAWDGSLSALDMIPVLAILFREFFISGLREFLGNAEVVLKVSQLAKWKTTVQLIALAVILLERIVPGLGLVSDIVLWLAGILTLWTGAQYLLASWPHLSGEAK